MSLPFPSLPFPSLPFPSLPHISPITSPITSPSTLQIMKNILSMPYSPNHVSIIVHRIDNTLLLDEFDVSRHLYFFQNWQWLRDFIFNDIQAHTKASRQGHLCPLIGIE